MTELEKFHQKFRIPDFTIRAYDHWIWSLRPVHSTLGAGVLSLRRYEPHFGGMTPAEGTELATVVKDVETKLEAAYAYDKINYLMLMMVDPHVHFHVLPRYEGARTAAGLTAPDMGWPGQPDLGQAIKLDAGQIAALTGWLKPYFA